MAGVVPGADEEEGRASVVVAMFTQTARCWHDQETLCIAAAPEPLSNP